jgi:hypothetical protein
MRIGCFFFVIMSQAPWAGRPGRIIAGLLAVIKPRSSRVEDLG